MMQQHSASATDGDGSRPTTSAAKKAFIQVDVGDYATSGAEKTNRYYLLPPSSSSSTAAAAAAAGMSKDVGGTAGVIGVQQVRENANDYTCNYVRLVHVPLEGSPMPFSVVMSPVGYAETVAIGGVDKGLVQKSCASMCHYETGQRYKSEIHIRSPSLRPVGFSETMLCYGHTTTRRHYRSKVDYRPKLVPGRFSDTQYVLPKQLSTTYVSYLDVDGPESRRKWYASAISVEPKAASNALLSRFRFLDSADEFEVNSQRRYDGAEVDGEEEEEDWVESGFSSDGDGVDVVDRVGEGGWYNGSLGGQNGHRSRLIVNT